LDVTPYYYFSVAKDQPRFFSYFKHVFAFNPFDVPINDQTPENNTTLWLVNNVQRAFDTYEITCTSDEAVLVRATADKVKFLIPKMITSSTGAVLSETAIYVPQQIESDRLIANLFERHLAHHLTPPYIGVAAEVARFMRDPAVFAVERRAVRPPRDATSDGGGGGSRARRTQRRQDAGRGGGGRFSGRRD